MKAVKGQVVANFIVDHKISDVEVKSAMDGMFVGQKSWIMYFDESKYKCGAGIGIVIISPTGVPTKIAFDIL
jgi:hypothetical protein